MTSVAGPFSDLRISFEQMIGGEYSVTARLDDGPPHASVFTMPMTDDEIRLAVAQLSTTRSSTDRQRNSPSVSRAAVVETQGNQKRTAEDFGTKLYDALIGGEVAKLFDEARSRGDGAVRIRLVMSKEQPQLLGIPWEFLCRNGTFLAAQPESPVVRELTTPERVSPYRITGKVRMLGVIASPKGPPPLNVEKEKQRVRDATASFADEIDIHWIDDCTFTKMQRALRELQPNILHFVGHSAFTDAGEAVLSLCDDEGNEKLVNDTTFANLIGRAPSLRLVVLNSCEGAQAGKDDAFTGIATKLVEQGRSAVVAMQFEITDEAASAFAGVFYETLVGKRYPVDKAVSEARKTVMGVNYVEFATPVLFLEDGEANVFQFPKSVPKRALVVSGAAIAAVAMLLIGFFALRGNNESATGSEGPGTSVASLAGVGQTISAASLLSVDNCLDSDLFTGADLFPLNFDQPATAVGSGIESCTSALEHLTTDGYQSDSLYTVIDDRISEAAGLMADGALTTAEEQQFVATADDLLDRADERWFAIKEFFGG